MSPHLPAAFEPGMLRVLVGSGDRIGLFALPFVLLGAASNVLYPSIFSLGGPPRVFRFVALGLLAFGIVVWAWSVALILAKVPHHELITTGPYAWVKHPLYTSVALVVLPSLGFMLDTWIGVPIGVALYVGSRLFSPNEERELAKSFGRAWDDYERSLKLPWL